MDIITYVKMDGFEPIGLGAPNGRPADGDDVELTAFVVMPAKAGMTTKAAHKKEAAGSPRRLTVVSVLLSITRSR